MQTAEFTTGVQDLKGWQNSVTSEEVGLAIVRQIQSNLNCIGSTCKILGLKLELTWNPTLPITHCAPVGKKTRWGGDNDYDAREKEVYSGYRGRVWFLYSHSPTNSLSEGTLKYTRFHTGTGGYGAYGGPFLPAHGYPLSYDCQLFSEDWPALREATMVELAMRKVSGSTEQVKLNFEWRAEHDERS